MRSIMKERKEIEERKKKVARAGIEPRRQRPAGRLDVCHSDQSASSIAALATFFSFSPLLQSLYFSILNEAP